MTSDSEIPALRSRIAELEDRLDYVYRHLMLEYPGRPEIADKKVMELLIRGNKIEAVKLYREIHNVGLAEAKKAVDGMESRMNL